MDAVYKNVNLILLSKGISARAVDDQTPNSTYLNMDSCEELAESAIATRLGSILINASDGAVYALPGPVTSLGKLDSLGGSDYRYAGADGNLYRRNAAGTGPYEIIASNMAESPWQSQNDSPSPISGIPFIFISSESGMLKDNGTLPTPQQMGIFQPQYPITAESQQPDQITLDNYVSSATDYAYTGISSGTIVPYVNTILTSSVTAPGLQEVKVADPTQIGLFQLLTVGTGPSQEVVLVLWVTPYGFIADFQNTHSSTVTGYSSTLLYAITHEGTQRFGVTSNSTYIKKGQVLTVDTGPNQENVTVIGIAGLPGFFAFFTKTHLAGVPVVWDVNVGNPVTSQALAVSVPASTTATIGITFTSLPAGTTPILGWPTTLNQEDYLGLYVYVSDPTQIQSITLKFDCGDGSFNSDYFYKVIAQGPLQAVLAAATSTSGTSSTTALTDAVLSESLGLYGVGVGVGGVLGESSTGYTASLEPYQASVEAAVAAASSAGSPSTTIAPLATGLDNWTPLLFQLSDFAGSGRADFNDAVFNWGAVNGYQVTVLMNDNSSATVQLAGMVLFGGAGPDTFAGVAYDYLFTFYNNVDGTESNPCMVMTNVFPPQNTNWVYPRRQPVLLTMFYPEVDPQTTSLRIYRRGGTLGDNYRRLDEVLITGSPQTYLDTSTDAGIQQSDFVSFTNDVPVTSTLQNPVNTTLLTAINTTNQVASVYPVSMASISVAQQVSIGVIGAIANNFETVIVLEVFSDHFTAYVQNTHAVGETISATAFYGQPVTIMAQAYGQFWMAGDPNNPSYLYWSNPSLPQAVSSAAYVQISTADDVITAIVQFKGNLYVSTLKGGWWSVAPGSNQNPSPTVYPTAARHGCIAPLGWVATEEFIAYQAVDGIRVFAGGGSTYITQEIEFLFQLVGSSPIVEADPTKLSQTRMAYWNMILYVSYVGMDENRHRLAFHMVYKRWRNDDVPATALLLETDDNLLVYGDPNGLVHIDRQIQAYDEGNDAGTLVQLPISMNLQSPFSDQGEPAVQKNYIHCLIDCNTNGATITVTLLFNDGQESLVLGTITTAERQRVNLPINDGIGFQAYKVSLQITGDVDQFVYIYQAGLQYVSLGITRKDYDSYWLAMNDAESKICKQIFWDFQSTAVVNFSVYYDGSTTPGFTFTLPNTNGVRSTERVRLPATLYRLIRFVAYSSSDFILYPESRAEYKVQCAGKGYMVEPFMS